MKKIFAFTLAEVVLVMGIIGVVAMLTVTNATKDTDVAARITQLRRCEEILSAGFAQAVVENGSIMNWNAGTSPTGEVIWNGITPYLKLQKNCGEDEGCWHLGEVSVLFSEQTFEDADIDANDKYYKGILANGASFAINDSTLSLLVDVDGPNKGNYRLGDDVFGFELNEGEVFPGGFNSNTLQSCIGNSGSGTNCTAWVLKFGNMDYLNTCRDELSWNGKHTCRN